MSTQSKKVPPSGKKIKSSVDKDRTVVFSVKDIANLATEWHDFSKLTFGNMTSPFFNKRHCFC